MITSKNPFSLPSVNPNFAGTSFDMFTLIESVKKARKFLSATAWDDFVLGEYGSLANAKTDSEIEAYVRSTGTTIFHAVGTASMSSYGASWGVVHPDLRVKGVEGLRIVDGSVLVSFSSRLSLSFGICFLNGLSISPTLRPLILKGLSSCLLNVQQT